MYEENIPTAGAKVYRVYDSKAFGPSWTPVDPRTVPGYAKAAGLYNTGRFLIEGTLLDASDVIVRSALPGPKGVGGGLPEWVIPNSRSQIQIDNVYGLNPEFNAEGYN